ncbi:MAG: insulinase family protein, partial [Blastocatellia bacterium]|nr:insulinase family protein [Blastocatellia bacterium]
GHNITGTKETLSKISRFDLSDFYDRVYLANNASLVIAGDFSAEKILPVLKKAFGGWKKGVPPPYTFVPPKAVEGVSVKLLEKEQPTVDVRIGGFALKRTESDYVAAKVLINILNDRLSRNGGKFKATLTARKLPGSFTLSANLPTPNQTSQEIVAAIAELKRLTDINAGELQAAKERTLQEYSRILSTESKIEEAAKDSNILIADRLAEIENYDLGSSYAFTTLVNRVSLEEVKRVAEKYFSANNLIVVAVGSGLQESLKTVGSVELLDK